jgi:tRNA (adenine57-N1/adenine58-N1)-methyltransferase
LNIDNQLVVINTPKNKYLSVVENNKEFITNEGKFKFSDIKKIPSLVTTSTGIDFQIYSPTYKEFVLLMKRGPQIIYPKDVGQIIVESNINNSSKVLEIGSGSGALTLYLYSLLKNSGKLYSLDSSKINQRRANKTITRYLSTYSQETVDVTFINDELSNFNYKSLEEKFDTIITDVPEPWDFFIKNTIENNIIWVSYLPSITQIIRLNEILLEKNFQDIEVKEVILRDWIVDEKIVRPSNKLVSHTGFLISAKYIKY